MSLVGIRLTETVTYYYLIYLLTYFLNIASISYRNKKTDIRESLRVEMAHGLLDLVDLMVYVA